MPRSEQLRVLIIDDSSDDAQLVVEALGAHDHEIVSCRVDEAHALRAALGRESWDIVISDYSMPLLTSEEALSIVKEWDPALPFIVVSGVIGEEAAVEMMRAGALDYVMKDRLGRLLPAILRELREAGEMKVMEATLRERDERYRQIVDNAEEGIWTVDTESRTTFVNHRMATMLGYSEEEMCGRHILDFVHDESLADVSERAERGRRGLSDSGEFALRRKDGESLRIHFAGSPLRTADGTLIGGLAMVTDITARWKAEETVLRQKGELEEAQRIAHLGSWRRNLPGDAMEWSDEMFRIFGLDPATSPTLTVILDAALPEDRDKVLRAIQGARHNSVPLNLDYRIVRPDGSIRSIHTFGEITRNKAGVPTHIRGVTQDVTDRVAAATVHENLTRHLQLLLESTTQGIFGASGYCPSRAMMSAKLSPE